MAIYFERTYRATFSTPGLVSFTVKVKESDLYISAAKDLSVLARASLLKHRRYIENYILDNNAFLTSHSPLDVDYSNVPEIVREMLKASRIANVGPMASVAGAIAERVGRDLKSQSDEVIVENGGDIYIDLTGRDARVSIFAGNSPLSQKLSLVFEAGEAPVSVCTSSATVGPSLSLGKADALCVVSSSGALADAAATSLANKVQCKEDIRNVLEEARLIEGVKGAVIILGDLMGAWGEITIE